MNKLAQIKRKYAGLIEIGHRYFREGDWDGVVDIVDGMERTETEYRRARVESNQAIAERRADPDAPRLEIPEGAPSGWVGDPAHRARMSPTLLRRIAADDAREAAEAVREERTRAAVIEQRQEEAILERWREDVALGIADVSDLPRYQMETAGRTRAEALAQLLEGDDKRAPAGRRLSREKGVA